MKKLYYMQTRYELSTEMKSIEIKQNGNASYKNSSNRGEESFDWFISRLNADEETIC
jgi:hypothetical protein